MNQPESPESNDVLGDLRTHLREIGEMGIGEFPSHTVKMKKPKRILREDVEEKLAELRRELNSGRHELLEGATKFVFGVGDPKAEIVFVGEAPGRDEDAQGEPFVGRAGVLLNKMIEAMGLKRQDVYITNIVKCRPPGNRYPLPSEVEEYLPIVLGEIAAIRPKVVVTLGNLAHQSLLKTKVGIMALHGKFQDFGGTQLLPTFHPAYLLRNPEMKREAWEDLKKVIKFLREN